MLRISLNLLIASVLIIPVGFLNFISGHLALLLLLSLGPWAYNTRYKK